jgi:hypothetical protein
MEVKFIPVHVRHPCVDPGLRLPQKLSTYFVLNTRVVFTEYERYAPAVSNLTGLCAARWFPKVLQILGRGQDAGNSILSPGPHSRSKGTKNPTPDLEVAACFIEAPFSSMALAV